MSDPGEWWERDLQFYEPSLSGYHQEWQDKRESLRNLYLQQSLSAAATVLQENAAWQELCERIRTTEYAEGQRLLYRTLSETEVARTQGALRVLRLIAVKPLDDKELARLEETVTVLRNRLEELQHILENPAEIQ